MGEIFSEILKIAGSLSDFATFALIALFVVIFQEDIRAKFFSKKKSPGEDLPEKSSKEWFDGIEEQISLLESNHLHHVQESVNEVLREMRDAVETQSKHGEKLDETRDTLRSIIRDGIRIRK